MSEPASRNAEAVTEPRYFLARSAAADLSFVTRQVAGETLIVPVSGSVADLESIFVLNEVGSHIWHVLSSPVTVDDLVRAVVATFDVTADAARADVQGFLEDLSSRRLVDAVEGEGRE